MLLAGVGIHPMDVTAPVDDACAEQLRQPAQSTPKVVAVSETGLDFDRGAPDLALQYQAFRAQVRLAIELGLPIIFHSREIPGQPHLHQEALKVLRQEQGWRVGGAMHYFQGDERTAQECLELGILHLAGQAAAATALTSRPSRRHCRWRALCWRRTRTRNPSRAAATSGRSPVTCPLVAEKVCRTEGRAGGRGGARHHRQLPRHVRARRGAGARGGGAGGAGVAPLHDPSGFLPSQERRGGSARAPA